MIKLADAQAQNFASSTRAELRAYAEELGLDNVPDNATSAVLKQRVMAALGMVVPNSGGGASPVAAKPIKAGKSAAIFPSYNLTPDGIWEGRRHRLSLPRPEGSQLAQAEGFDWNGKHTYYIAYDEVTDVPEPIYQMIATMRRVRVVPRRTTLADGTLEVTTEWAHDPVSFSYLGPDPLTGKRAGSLMEWYQSRGTQFFHERSLRELSAIAVKVDRPVTRYVGPGLPPQPLNEVELRESLLEFFFGYPDAEADANEAIEA